MTTSRKKGIPSDWLRHLPKEEQRAEFEKTLRHSRAVLTRMQEILEERLAALDRVEANLESYMEPSWAYKQAHINGKRAELTSLLLLLDFIDG